MRKPFTSVAFTAAFAIICTGGLIGCSGLVQNGPGTLVIEFDGDQLVARTIAPNLNMNVASLSVHGDGPGGASFDLTDSSSMSPAKASLQPGSWTVTVEAFNSDSPPVLIGDGSATATVQSGSVTAAQVKVTPIAGKGNLSLTVSWPDGTVANPSIVAGMDTPFGNLYRTVPMSFTISGSQATYSGTGIDAGYYAMSLQLKDGSKVVWGTEEAVRIVAGRTTSGSYTLNNVVNSGGLSLSVSNGVSQSISVSLSGVRQLVGENETMQVSASPSDASTYDYNWYVDGTLLPGQSGSSVGLGPWTNKVVHTVAAVVNRGSVLGSATEEFTVTDPAFIASRISGGSADALITPGGALWMWGPSSLLGNGSVSPVPSLPTRVGTASDWSRIATGGHMLAIKSDGTLWAWGANGNGQLGTTSGTTNSPQQVGIDTDWKSASSGVELSLAIKTDGTLWAWGWNGYGQYGNGTTVSVGFPEQIGAETDWAQVSAGVYDSLALKSDGSLWSAGYNWTGQLGDGTMNNSAVFSQVGSSSDWASISAGPGGTSMAIKTDGTLWAWGANRGQQISPTGSSFTTPTQIGTDADWRSVSQGYDFAAAIKSNGTLWTWGGNSDGQLGRGASPTNPSTPGQVGTDTDWVAVSAGNSGCVALKSDGTVWWWGRDASASTNAVSSATPVQLRNTTGGAQ